MSRQWAQQWKKSHREKVEEKLSKIIPRFQSFITLHRTMTYLPMSGAFSKECAQCCPENQDRESSGDSTSVLQKERRREKKRKEEKREGEKKKEERREERRKEEKRREEKMKEEKRRITRAEQIQLRSIAFCTSILHICTLSHSPQDSSSLVIGTSRRHKLLL